MNELEAERQQKKDTELREAKAKVLASKFAVKPAQTHGQNGVVFQGPFLNTQSHNGSSATKPQPPRSVPYDPASPFLQPSSSAHSGPSASQTPLSTNGTFPLGRGPATFGAHSATSSRTSATNSPDFHNFSIGGLSTSQQRVQQIPLAGPTTVNAQSTPSPSGYIIDRDAAQNGHQNGTFGDSALQTPDSGTGRHVGFSPASTTQTPNSTSPPAELGNDGQPLEEGEIDESL